MTQTTTAGVVVTTKDYRTRRPPPRSQVGVYEAQILFALSFTWAFPPPGLNIWVQVLSNMHIKRLGSESILQYMQLETSDSRFGCMGVHGNFGMTAQQKFPYASWKQIEALGTKCPSIVTSKCQRLGQWNVRPNDQIQGGANALPCAPLRDCPGSVVPWGFQNSEAFKDGLGTCIK